MTRIRSIENYFVCFFLFNSRLLEEVQLSILHSSSCVVSTAEEGIRRYWSSANLSKSLLSYIGLRSAAVTENDAGPTADLE